MTGGVPVVMVRKRNNYNTMYIPIVVVRMVTCSKLAMVIAQLFSNTLPLSLLHSSLLFKYHYSCQC